MTFSMNGIFSRSHKKKAGALAAALAMVSMTSPALAQEAAPAVEEKVAVALATAHVAQNRSDREGLARALGIIERSGARPLKNWQGKDPVPAWRELVPDQTPPLRGSALGPGYRSGKILAGQSDSFEQVFLSGQKASIALSTPGNAPISLEVLDAARRPVCQLGSTQRACRWVPLFTQRYSIEVRNRGRQIADYFLVVD